MLNQIVLVGRLTRDITVNKSESGVKVATIGLAIPRSYKNMDGNYDTDFLDVTAFDLVATNTAEYCKKGDIIGIKGRVQSRVIGEEGNTPQVMELIAEKVTFLSTAKNKDKEELIEE